MLQAKAHVADMETMEAHQNEVSQSEKDRYSKAKGMGICKYPYGLLANSR